VGKSTLAAYFYHSLDFDVKFWGDVSLKPDFTIFAAKIISALGGKVSYPIDITEITSNLLGLLSQRRCLLVVDNLETLLDADRNWQDEFYQQFFNRWKDQGTCSTLLITTQDKPKLFQGLPHWYSLGGTFVDDVDGHPLTINLVAGYLREYYNSQLSQVEELGLGQFELAYEEAEGLHRNKEDARLFWIIQQDCQKSKINS